MDDFIKVKSVVVVVIVEHEMDRQIGTVDVILDRSNPHLCSRVLGSERMRAWIQVAKASSVVPILCLLGN